MPPHCDSLDGPVVTAAARALQTGNVELVLPYVHPDGEAEVREAFARVPPLRTGGDGTGELADRWFYETVVRVHRAAEGALTPGLPAGLDPGPVLPLAERAVESGQVDAVCIGCSPASCATSSSSDCIGLVSWRHLRTGRWPTPAPGSRRYRVRGLRPPHLRRAAARTPRRTPQRLSFAATPGSRRRATGQAGGAALWESGEVLQSAGRSEDRLVGDPVPCRPDQGTQNSTVTAAPTATTMVRVMPAADRAHGWRPPRPHLTAAGRPECAGCGTGASAC